jgi:sugar phosphate isomerase/epimerase
VKIAYGTYAMPTVPLEEAIPVLAEIGHRGVEICISQKHVGAMPEEMDAQRRRSLRGLLEEKDMGVPALFLLGSIHTDSPERHRENLELMRTCAGLARDLGLREPPVLAMGIGGKKDEWDDIKGRLIDLLGDHRALAEEEDFVLAGEAHCGAAVNCSERFTWLLDQVGSPRIRAHFDIVHMFLAGEKIEDSVKALVPYTAHTHITDAIRNPDGSLKQLVLLGNGELDSTAYMKAMAEAGWDDFITLEVSMMVWSKPEYDPIEAAKFSYDSLAAAFDAAGVARG